MQRLAPALCQDNVPQDLISLIKTILAAAKEISFHMDLNLILHQKAIDMDVSNYKKIKGSSWL